MNPNRSVTFTSVVFIIVALVMAAASAYFGIRQVQFSQTAVKATGTVVQMVRKVSNKGNVSYYPLVSFKDSKGNEVEFKSRVSSDYYQVGSSVPVVYDPAHPRTAYIDTFMGRLFMSVFVAGFAVIFGGVGGGIAYARYRRKKIIEYLKTNGRRVKTLFTSVGHNTYYKVNGRSPFIIHAQWQDSLSNKMITFKSDSLWFDPSPYVKLDMNIEVIVDPNDFTKYWMDTDFLPQQ